MITVTYINREFRKTNYSIEGIFDTVKKVLNNKITIRNLYADGSTSRLQNILRIRKEAGELNHITGDVNFLAIGLGGKKNVLTIHDLGYYENPIHPWHIKTVYKLFWFTLPLKFIDRVTVVSEFTKSKLIQYFDYPADKITVIPNPVKSFFVFSKRQLHPGPVRILQIGSGKHKNVGNMIEAVNGLPCHVDIVGWPDAEETAKLKEYNISYSVYNALTDEQLLERYQACDILFFASLYEGFGMPIIEAQAVGRAVITSNIGAMKEVAGDTAVLVDPNDPMAIKEAILKLSNDPLFYDEMVRKGSANADRYDHENIANQYLEVYKALANGK